VESKEVPQTSNAEVCATIALPCIPIAVIKEPETLKKRAAPASGYYDPIDC
jgi:hypothetical protein